MTRITIKLNLLVFALAAFFLPPGLTPKVAFSKSAIPSFTDFSKSTRNSDAHVLRGVYVSNILTLPIIQQPVDDPYYVSDNNGEVTEFSTASRYGNIGLLAHNNLSGKFFSKLAVGQEADLIYEDGEVEKFIVTEVLHFQALQPDSQLSSFLNLDDPETLSANQMFNRVYTGSHHLIFQTCIDAYGNASWGRLFILATPKVR